MEIISKYPIDWTITLLLLLIPYLLYKKSILYILYLKMNEYQKWILVPLFIISFLLGFYFYNISYGLHFWQSVYYALTLFIGEVKLPVEIGLLDANTTISTLTSKQIEENYYSIYIAAFLAMLTSFLTFLLLFFHELVQKSYAKHIIEGGDYTLVIGLGENNYAYIESELRDKNQLIIIEKDKNNPYIKYFEDKRVGVLNGTIEDYISIIEKNYPKIIIISVGSDRHNIDISMIIEKSYREIFDHKINENDRTVTIYMHLDNQTFETMYQKRILSKNKQNNNLEFRPYSFYDDVARSMCMEHTVLGNYQYEHNTIFEKYNIVMIGHGKLAERILYHLCMLTHLPNQNIFNIICISSEAKAFIERVRALFPSIDNIKSVHLEAVDLNYTEAAFYSSEIWERKNLTNVIVCDNDENTNLKTAVELFDKLFFRLAINQIFKTKILIAMYHNLDLAESINVNKDEFRNFHTFGAIEKICIKDHLINETHESLAQLIHYGYGDVYDINNENFVKYIDPNSDIKQNILKKWKNYTKYSDRESNRSQALHIDTKLFSIGLKCQKIDKDKFSGNLLENNNKIFSMYSEIEKFYSTISRERIWEFSKQLPHYYNGCNIDENIINEIYDVLMQNQHVIAKLMRSEHERWNAFHYLNGWIYSQDKNKDIKEHDCLTEMELFNDIARRITVIYDLYSVLYIPSYLASVGYEIVPTKEDNIENNTNNKISIGITGHRTIDMNDHKLREELKKELEKITKDYDEVTLLSPLAEGADRLFVEIAFEILPEKIKKLTIPMPFDKTRYLQDFTTKESKQEFEKYFDKSNLEIDSFSVFLGKDDAQSYMNVGKCVVNKSDILIALWDGKKANGIGGTGDVVAYAKKTGQNILYINTETREEEYINFDSDVFHYTF